MGRTISATEAMVTPAKPEVTYCCPHASSEKGRAELMMPIVTSTRMSEAEGRAVKSANPRRAQSASITTAANPIREAASQKGVIPVSATSVKRKVPPQTNPKRAISSQLVSVI